MSTASSMSNKQTTPTAGVGDARFARLARGINLSHWFAQAPRYDKAHFEAYNTLDDIKLIKSIGFSHVRFTLNPVPLLNEREPDRLNPEVLQSVDRALDMILGQELAVIVDPHPEDDFKLSLRDSDDSGRASTTCG